MNYISTALTFIHHILNEFIIILFWSVESYSIRYSFVFVDLLDDAFLLADQFGMEHVTNGSFVPKVAGSHQRVTFRVPNTSHQDYPVYYIGLRSYDRFGQSSNTSNIVSTQFQPTSDTRIDQQSIF